MPVLPDTQEDEEDTSHETDWPTDLDTTEYREWLVDLSEVEIRFRIEEHSHHRNAANEMAYSDDETRSKPIQPLVRLIKCIRCRNRPAVTGFDSMYCPEQDCSDQETERFPV